MGQAKSLADLLQIRAANATLIDQFTGHLGTALGFKYIDGQATEIPAVIIFVPRKLNEALLPPSQLIPKELQGPNGLTCPTDVMVGKKAINEPPPPPLSPENQRRVNDLQSGRIGLIGGIQLGFFERNSGFVGTAACKVRHKSTGKVGFLTNQHVGGPPGRPMYHPEPGQVRIGFTRASWEMDPDDIYFNGLIDEENAYYRIDCAFVELSEQAAAISQSGLYEIGPIQPPAKLDLNTMGPIGMEVTSIGRTRGLEEGRVIAFGYEWYDNEESIYTDYLIIGNDGQVFSDHGDSGKLIVSKENSRALALLWGGWFESLRQGHGQENWTYAIDINKVLGKLELEILT